MKKLKRYAIKKELVFALWRKLRGLEMEQSEDGELVVQLLISYK